MKKLINLFYAGIILTGTCLWLAGCKKEANSVEKPQKTNECTTCKDGEMLANRINQFKDAMSLAKNNAKSDVTISFNEAITNMELLINAAHGFPFDSYSKRKNIVLSFQLPKNSEGNVILTDVAAAYEQMHTLVRNEYINCEFAEKWLILVSLAENKTSKNDGTIDVMITIGEKGGMETNPFNDCWYYGERLGMCNGSFFLEKDGADTIASMINANNPIHRLCDHPGPGHHLVIEPKPLIVLQGFEYLLENNYLMFFRPDNDNNGFSSEEMQLSATEMSQYYYNEEYLIHNLLPQIYNYQPFPRYVLINCVMEGSHFNYQQKDNLRHKNTLQYASVIG